MSLSSSPGGFVWNALFLVHFKERRRISTYPPVTRAIYKPFRAIKLCLPLNESVRVTENRLCASHLVLCFRRLTQFPLPLVNTTDSVANACSTSSPLEPAFSPNRVAALSLEPANNAIHETCVSSRFERGFTLKFGLHGNSTILDISVLSTMVFENNYPSLVRCYILLPKMIIFVIERHIIIVSTVFHLNMSTF